VVDESQDLTNGVEVPTVGRRGRRPRLGRYAAIVGLVLLSYIVPLLGFMVSIAVLIALLVMRRELWGAAVRPSALLVVLVWVGLWLPAVSYMTTGWYWYLTGGEVSTGWLLFPIQAPSDLGILVAALAAAVVFAVGLTVSAVLHRPWLVVVGAWLAPWAHQLATTVTEMG
jgi:hypothetical protein